MRIYNAIIIEDGDVISVKSFAKKEDALAVINADKERISKKYGNPEFNDFTKNEVQKEVFGMQYYEKEGYAWETGCSWGTAQVIWSDVDANA